MVFEQQAESDPGIIVVFDEQNVLPYQDVTSRGEDERCPADLGREVSPLRYFATSISSENRV